MALLETKKMARTELNDVMQGLFETSAEIKGNWKTSWVMQLRRKPGKCRLPRGFAANMGKTQIIYVSQ